MAAFLGMLQDFLGPVFVAIASGPAFQLSWGPAAELEKLLPMLLHKVEDPGDGGFLFFLRSPEGLPADVNVKAAGLGLVGTVAQRAGCAQDFRPGHLFLVVLQAHGMRDQLETIAEGTVVLTVEPLGETGVGLGQNLAGVVTPLAAFVDLQLDSEVPWTRWVLACSSSPGSRPGLLPPGRSGRGAHRCRPDSNCPHSG